MNLARVANPVAAIASHRQIGGLIALGTVFMLAAVTWTGPASANDRYANATGKDCSSCHVDVDRNAYMFTRYGAAFRRNGCPNVRGGC